MGDRTASKMDIEAIAKAAAGVADGDEKKLSEEGKESETKPPKVNSKRIWAYSEPEYKLLAFGAVVALVNGCIFPSIAFVFAEMLSLFYSADTDYIMQYGYVFAGIFIGISAAAWIIGGTQGGVFAIIGERLTTRLRVHLFRAILRQEVSYFDDPKNSVGALTANLRTDTALVQSATGKSFGSAVQTFGSLIFGLTLAMTASWKYGLVLLAAVPILSVGEMINMQNIASGDSIVSESMGRCAALVSESATMIREVKAFGLENRMYDAYDALLKVPHREERNKALRSRRFRRRAGHDDDVLRLRVLVGLASHRKGGTRLLRFHEVSVGARFLRRRRGTGRGFRWRRQRRAGRRVSHLRAH